MISKLRSWRYLCLCAALTFSNACTGDDVCDTSNVLEKIIDLDPSIMIFAQDDQGARAASMTFLFVDHSVAYSDLKTVHFRADIEDLSSVTFLQDTQDTGILQIRFDGRAPICVTRMDRAVWDSIRNALAEWPEQERLRTIDYLE